MDIQELKKKSEVIDAAVAQLKTEFVGIDEQIDNIVENVRSWFLFPELGKKPIVINLWGMSGCGKTALVHRLVELMGCLNRYIYVNCTNISEYGSEYVRGQFGDRWPDTNGRCIFALDEFQYANILDKNGNEDNNKFGLKTLWKLIDDGILHVSGGRYSRDIYNQALKIYKEFLSKHHIRLDSQGRWINYKECLKVLDIIDIMNIYTYFNFDLKNAVNPLYYAGINRIKDIGRPYVDSPTAVETTIENDGFILNTTILSSIRNTLEQVDPNNVNNILSEIRCDDINKIIGLIQKCYNAECEGYNYDFSNSIIFVIGNLDEAYQMSYDMNPDMSADKFHKLTQNLTIVDIKNALQKRFRNEQIARLGNIHVIYPSFSSASFRKIIVNCMDDYVRDIYDTIQCKVTYDKSIVNIIYKEGVFPTQGTRPIFSTIQEHIKSKLPKVMQKCLADGIEMDAVHYTYRSGYINAHVFKDGMEKAVYKFKDRFKIDELRRCKNNDEQAIVSVHESGHFIMHLKFRGTLPDRVSSVASDSSIGGYMECDKTLICGITSAGEILNNIKICLGGYAAEEAVFGKRNVTTSAQKDLLNATTMASRYVRKYCMGNFKYVNTYSSNVVVNEGGEVINENNQEEINKEIKNVMDSCWADVHKVMNNQEWYNALIKSAKYLFKHPYMHKKKMKEIYDGITEDKLNGQMNKGDYVRMLENL